MARKKSQMEIMGLVVIVLLIMLGMMFALRFMMSGDTDRDVKAEFEDTQLAANMLNAMLRSTSGCKGYSITTLLQDCGSGEKIVCNDAGSSVQKSCANVSATVKGLLDETLNKRMYKRYEFSIDKLDKNQFTFSHGAPCLEKVSKFSPISYSRGTIIVRLSICTDVATVSS